MVKKFTPLWQFGSVWKIAGGTALVCTASGFLIAANKDRVRQFLDKYSHSRRTSMEAIHEYALNELGRGKTRNIMENVVGAMPVNSTFDPQSLANNVSFMTHEYEKRHEDPYQAILYYYEQAQQNPHQTVKLYYSNYASADYIAEKERQTQELRKKSIERKEKIYKRLEEKGWINS